MILSKSDYMLFLKHPAWLWLKKYDKNKLPPVDDNTQAVFDAGNLFEKYAEQLFPNGIRLGFNNYNEYLELPTRTIKTLDDGAKTIFQGRFEYNQLTFICDVIVVVGDKVVDLYEIKSSTKAKPEHEFDLAFQMVVLETCGYKIGKIAVIHVNNEYVRNGAIDAKEITEITDITEEVKEKREDTKVYIKMALEVAESSKIPNISPSLARQDVLGEWLDIYRGLTTVQPYSIYDLCAPSAERIGTLESLNIKSLIDIPDDFALSAKQKLQVSATKLDQAIIDKDKIKSFLSKLVFPLYFLDYETLASIVPYFDGLRPYQQLPFQYSLHIFETPEGELKHTMYLHRENSNPKEALSKSLQKNIGNKGSVIVWNESFEKSCNTLMGKLEPNFEPFYKQVNERIVDLMIPFSKSWYVHKDFGGSASIKKVLPVLVPKLSYNALPIHEGTGAQRLWMETVLDGKRDDSREQILNDLEEYCKLDTLAMVEIYKQLIKL